MNTLRYYRCTGADGYRFSGQAVCKNRPLRGDQLEQVVWDQVRTLLEDPRRVADEYHRRLAQARDGAALRRVTAPPCRTRSLALDRQMTSLRRGIGRLIESPEGIIDKTEFEPRIVGLRQRLSQLRERHQAALEAEDRARPRPRDQPPGRLLRQGDQRARQSRPNRQQDIIAPSYAGSKSTTVALRLSSGSHHQMVHRDQDHQPKQPILGNIVQALVERTFAWTSRNRRLARDFERHARNRCLRSTWP